METPLDLKGDTAPPLLACLRDLIAHGWGELNIDLRTQGAQGVYTTKTILQASEEEVMKAIETVLTRWNGAIRVQVLNRKITCMWQTFLSCDLTR